MNYNNRTHFRFINKTVHRDQLKHSNTITDIKFSNDGALLITVSGDKSINITHFESNQQILKINNAHDGTIECVLIATSGRDGKIKGWDLRVDKKSISSPVFIIGDKNCATGSRKRKSLSSGQYLNCVSKIHRLFDDLNIIASTSRTDPRIYIWDLRYTETPGSSSIGSSFPLTSAHYPGDSKMGEIKRSGYIDMNDDGRYLYVSCVDKNIYCYEMNKLFHGLYSYAKQSDIPQSIAIPTDWTSESHYANIDIDVTKEYLATGMLHERAYIWNLARKQTPIVSLENGSRANLTFAYFSPSHELEIVSSSSSIPLTLW
ncbi:hypothetical protein HZS_8146 [Henneguya salminicola]|nr:hypothetical protein HZS_8146 [Henneguya salminicola]